MFFSGEKHYKNDDENTSAKTNLKFKFTKSDKIKTNKSWMFELAFVGFAEKKCHHITSNAYKCFNISLIKDKMRLLCITFFSCSDHFLWVLSFIGDKRVNLFFNFERTFIQNDLNFFLHQLFTKQITTAINSTTIKWRNGNQQQITSKICDKFYLARSEIFALRQKIRHTFYKLAHKEWNKQITQMAIERMHR